VRGPAVATVAAAVQPPKAVPELTLTPDERINIDVYNKCNRSVVNITTKAIAAEFFGLYEYAEGGASGIVYDKNGHIMTNYHVLADVLSSGGELKVTLHDGTDYMAKFVGRDPHTDLAVVQIDAAPDKLVPIELGDSSNLRVGLRVLAIGNPFGLDRTMTQGIISSLNRTVESPNGRYIRGVIQTDAAINPGNSGGPLLDKNGRMIGMNTAIKARVGQSSGIAFATPVNSIRRVLPQLLQYGKVLRGDLGILTVLETERGLIIGDVAVGGPAEQAGLRSASVRRRSRFGIVVSVDWRRADRIVSIDGHPMRTADDLTAYVDSRKPGDVVKVTILREGERIELPVKLQQADS
jgi:S1-C subfamily serine protease